MAWWAAVGGGGGADKARNNAPAGGRWVHRPPATHPQMQPAPRSGGRPRPLAQAPL